MRGLTLARELFRDVVRRGLACGQVGDQLPIGRAQRHANRSDAVATSDFRVDDLEQHRRELTGYCEGRSTVRSWLYRIATNVCLDMLRGRQRRARPMDLGPS